VASNIEEVQLLKDFFRSVAKPFGPLEAKKHFPFLSSGVIVLLFWPLFFRPLPGPRRKQTITTAGLNDFKFWRKSFSKWLSK